MTKRDMMTIILANNVNKDIKWAVAENTKNLVVLTNSYDKDIRFEIRLNQGDGKDIDIVDVNGWNPNVGYLIQGNEFYADFEDEATGITRAVEMIVRFFYYYY